MSGRLYDAMRNVGLKFNILKTKVVGLKIKIE